MSLKLKQSDQGGAVRRRPLLPDDRFLDAVVHEVAVGEVEDRFNGGLKKVVIFTLALPKFKDPQSDDGSPRRVRIKVNLPGSGNVHSKSNLYKLVCCCWGKDPWKKNDDFDIETTATKKRKLKIMLETSDPIEQEVEEEDGTTHKVNDYQYQYVNSWRTASGQRADEAEEEEEEGSDEYTPSKGDMVTVDCDGENYDGEVIRILKGDKAKVKFDDGSVETYPFSALDYIEGEEEEDEEEGEEDEEEEEGEEEEEEEEEEGEAAPAPVLKALLAGVKKKAKTEAGKKLCAKVFKKLEIGKLSELNEATQEVAEKVAKALKFKLPEADEEEEDDLSFLD